MEEKKRAQVCISQQSICSSYFFIHFLWFFASLQHLDCLQVVAKLHAILRPFLLRRMKSDVEQDLPQKKEIIIYATLTEHQRNFQDHLINRTLEGHLTQNATVGMLRLNFIVYRICNHVFCSFQCPVFARTNPMCILFLGLMLSTLHCWLLLLNIFINVAGRCSFKGKLNNLMIQLRKNCNHPDLLEGAFDGSCT